MGGKESPDGHSPEEDTMQYVILIYDEETANPSAEPPPPEVQQQVMAEYTAYTKWLVDRGVYKGGEALQPVPTATTVRIRDGRTITTDGPFAETKEALGGFYLVEAKDLDEALDFGARCPGAKFGSIEVRPILELPPEYQDIRSQAVGSAS
jgi:hypothetical protein